MKYFLILFLIVCSNAFAAFESTTDYNTINFAYNATTVQQRINFNSSMQSGGTFNFDVQARNGGGRNYSQYPTQDDTGNVKIIFYNASNGIVNTVQTSFTRNLRGPSQWSGAPGDTDQPFQTLSISSSNCGGSCATVAYAVVQMIGTDGAYWAGNYGPQWKVPTFTFNGGANMLYNPEFGSYSGTLAQGWTPSGSSFASNCGTTSGASICVTANAAATVNKSGGGYSSVANTSSAPAGGYTSTLTVSNQTPSAGPTITSTTTTYSTRTSTSGSTTYNYRTPTTVNTYSDNTSTSTVGSESLFTTAVTSTQINSKVFGNRTLNYSIPVVTTTVASTGASTTSPVTPATIPSGYISIVPYTGGGGWQFKTYTYTATTTGTGYLMFAFRHDPNYWVIDNVSVKANNAGANLLVNGGLEQSGMLTTNVGGTQQTVAAPTAWGLAYQDNATPTLGGGFDSGMWFDTSVGSYGAIYQNINFTAGVTYTITFMVASDYNSDGDTVQMALYAGSCNSAGSACTLPASTGMTTAVTPSQTYSVGCSPNCPVDSTPQGPTIEGGTITQSNAPTNQTITSGGSSTAGPSLDQTTRYNSWNNGVQATDNYLYIEQVSGNYNTVNITQSGTKNTMDLGINGNSNTVNATQTGVNYLNALVQGNLNSVTSLQTNITGTNYQETKIMSGNNNTINVTQKDNGNNLMFNTITGSSNSISAVQEGGGNHYLENKLTGNGHSILVNQSGSTANKANIDLTNSGGAANIDLQQSGGKSFSIIQSCVNPAGCSTVIRQ
jgi:hypothetical protein